MRIYFSQKFRFLIIGGVNTFFGFAFFTGTYLLLHEKFSKFILVFFSNVVAIFFSHFTQRYFVWKSKKPYLKEITKFGSSYLLFMLLNLIFLYIATDIFDFEVLWSQYAISILIIALAYVVQKRFIFKE